MPSSQDHDIAQELSLKDRQARDKILSAYISQFESENPANWQERKTLKSLVPGIKDEDVRELNRKGKDVVADQIIDHYRKTGESIPAPIYWYMRSSQGEDSNILSDKSKILLKRLFGHDDLSKLDAKQLQLLGKLSFQDFTTLPPSDEKSLIESIQHDFGHSYKEDGSKKTSNSLNPSKDYSKLLLSDTLTALAASKAHPNLKPRLLAQVATRSGGNLGKTIPSLKADITAEQTLPNGNKKGMLIPLTDIFNENLNIDSSDNIDKIIKSKYNLSSPNLESIRSLVGHTHPIFYPRDHQLPEMEARKFLASQGVYPGTQEYADKYQKSFSPEELKRTIQKGLPLKPSIQEAADYTNAIEQARHNSKSPYFETYPTYEHTEKINPNQFPGELLAPIHDSTHEGFIKGQELRNLVTQIQDERNARFQPLEQDIEKNNAELNKARKIINPEMESLLKNIYTKANAINNENTDFLSSNDYKRAHHLAEKKFDVMKKEREEAYQDRLVRLRTSFRSHGSLQSSIAKKAELNLERDHKRELDNLKLQLEDREETLARQTFAQRHSLDRDAYDKLEKALASHQGQYTHLENQMRTANQLAGSKEDLLKNHEAQKIAAKQAEMMSLHGEGEHQRRLEQQKIQAALDKFNNRPGGIVDQQRVGQAVQVTNNSPAMSVPVQQAAYTSPSMPNNSAIQGAVYPYIATQVRNMFSPNIQQQQNQQMNLTDPSYPPAFAEGGRARRVRDDASKIREEQMFNKFMEEKMRHEQQPAPILDPNWRAVSEIAAAMPSGPNETYVGALTKANLKADEHRENALKTKYLQSKERVDMQETLAELANKLREGEYHDNSLEQKYEEMDLNEVLKRLELQQIANLKDRELTQIANLKDQEINASRSLEEYKAKEKMELEEYKAKEKMALEKYKSSIPHAELTKQKNEARSQFKLGADLMADASVAKALSPYYSENILPMSIQSSGSKAFDAFAQNTNAAYEKITGNKIEKDGGLSGFKYGAVNEAISDQYMGQAADATSIALENYFSLDRNGTAEDFRNDISQEEKDIKSRIITKVKNLAKTRGLSEDQIDKVITQALLNFTDQYTESTSKVLKRKNEFMDLQ